MKYIKSIELKNIKCFEDFNIDLERNNHLNFWTTILGDNAVGKSTILRCIAIGLCDETSAGALLKETSGEYLRKGSKSGHIKIEMKDYSNNEVATITTNLTKQSLESPERLRQKISGKITPWRDIFVCGYGVHIRDGGGDAFELYQTLEAVYTLFNTNSDLQNPELILLRQNPKLRRILHKKLLDILMLEDYKIRHLKNGMFFYGPFGKQKLENLSDGYRSTIQWTVDFLGWVIIANRFSVKDEDITGILLIDELETHLHPRWQRYIIDRLKHQFPKIQFIVTTHSPMITLGTADLKDSFLIELGFDKENNHINNREINPEVYKGMRVDQVLISSAFNLPSSRSGKTGDKILDFQNLYLKEYRTMKEEQKYNRLKKTIMKDMPEIGETAADRKLQIELKEILNSINKKLKIL